jgi:hypothetical protein
MGWKRGLLRALLAILIVFDLLLVLQARRHGWPVTLSGQSLGDGRTQVSVNPLTFTAVDWLLAILLVGVQGLVIYGNWRVGRPVGKQH